MSMHDEAAYSAELCKLFRLQNGSGWRILDVWWMLLIQNSSTAGKAAAAAQKIFQHAVQEYPFSDDLLHAAVHGHSVTLKVGFVRLPAVQFLSLLLFACAERFVTMKLRPAEYAPSLAFSCRLHVLPWSCLAR
jgi:hypothetical protein